MNVDIDVAEMRKIASLKKIFHSKSMLSCASLVMPFVVCKLLGVCVLHLS